MKTQVFIVADCSGSMRGEKEAKMRELAAEYLKALDRSSKELQQAFEVTLVPFADSVVKHVAQPPNKVDVGNITTYGWGLGGYTALLDAIGYALTQHDGKSPALVQVYTDGEENRSVQFTNGRLAGLIRQKEATGLVSIACVGPQQAVRPLMAAGIPDGNIKVWDGSAKEMAAVQAASVTAVETYTSERKKGITRSAKLFADTSNLDPSGVRGRTKQIVPKAIETVTTRMAGRTIADHYKGSFKPGNHYYQLLKAEYIQDDKDMVIFIKQTNEYRIGSRSIRELLGLPETGKVRVHPGPTNDKYDLFVQSNSVNRKLVEGQQLLTIE